MDSYRILLNRFLPFQCRCPVHQVHLVLQDHKDLLGRQAPLVLLVLQDLLVLWDLQALQGRVEHRVLRALQDLVALRVLRDPELPEALPMDFHLQK